MEKDDTQFLRFYQSSVGYLATISIMPITVGLDLILMGRCKYGCSNDDRLPVMEVLFPTTTYTYESTKGMRCPGTSYYVNKFLEIAECYEKRNNKESLTTALTQINYLDEEYESGPTCISIRDAQVVKETKNRLTKAAPALGIDVKHMPEDKKITKKIIKKDNDAGSAFIPGFGSEMKK